jgi:hypothetical protein
MNQLAKLYQTKCIQLQEQIENLERLLEAAQTSTASDKAWQDANNKAMADAVAKAREEKEKKEAEEAAKPKKPDNWFTRTYEKHPTFTTLGAGALGLLAGTQVLPRWGGDKKTPGTLAKIERSVEGEQIKQVSPDVQIRTKVDVPIEPHFVPATSSKPGSFFGNIKKVPTGIGGVHGAFERFVSVPLKNKAIASAETLKKAEFAAEIAKQNVPVHDTQALIAASDKLKTAQEASKAADLKALGSQTLEKLGIIAGVPLMAKGAYDTYQDVKAGELPSVGSVAELGAGTAMVAPKTTGKAITGALTKIAPATAAKIGLTKIPLVGAAVGLGFAAKRASAGDWLGAAGEAASGIAGTVPGLGTAVSAGIDAALLARDLYDTSEDEEKKKTETLKSQMGKPSKPSEVKVIGPKI